LEATELRLTDDSGKPFDGTIPPHSSLLIRGYGQFVSSDHGTDQLTWFTEVEVAVDGSSAVLRGEDETGTWTMLPDCRPRDAGTPSDHE
jgi:hypothetical protein